MSAQQLAQALRGTIAELESVVRALNAERMPHDGDEFHERLEAAKKALAAHQAAPQQEPVAEVYRAHHGGRSRNIGFDDVRPLRGATLPPPGTKLYAAPQQAQAPGWQDIATAPKDGRTVQLGYFNSHGKWRSLRGQWMSADYIAEYWEDPDEGEPGWYETSVEKDDTPNCWRTEPTHWAPLLAAPQQGSKT